MKKILSFIMIVLSAGVLSAQDTFSITAVDTVTGEVGSAGASCIDETAISQGCYILSDVKPGIGVIHTQAYWIPANQNYAGSLMDMGLSPEDIIDSLVANDAQNNPTIRQYGIIDLFEGSPRTAAYTGINCDDYKNHILGPNYTIQGNILLGQQILDSMEARFLATEGELACKLMAALQGAKVIGADTRCLDDGVSSLSAFLRVGQPMDPPDDLYLDINVPQTPFGIDPIDSLQALVDQWGGCLVSDKRNFAENKEQVLIYPNPSGKLLIIETNTQLKSATFTLFDSKGRKVFTKKNCAGKHIRIQTDLPNGLYMYQLTDKLNTLDQGKMIGKALTILFIFASQKFINQRIEIMNVEAFFKLTYGIYLITSRSGEQITGYIANTAFQVTATPPKIAISCHKENTSAGIIKKSGVFCLSVLDKDSDAGLIGMFGYQSGNEEEKFKRVNHKTGKNGAPIILTHSIAYFECKVVDTIDVGTHYLFIGEVTEGELLNREKEPLTYAYFRDEMKLLAPERAPTYVDKSKIQSEDSAASDFGPSDTKEDTKAEEQKTESKVYICSVCAYEYDPAVGDETQGIPPGTPFEDLPDDWICPICAAAKSAFISSN